MELTQNQKEILEANNIKSLRLRVTLNNKQQIELKTLEELLLHIQKIERIGVSYETKEGEISMYGLVTPRD